MLAAIAVDSDNVEEVIASGGLDAILCNLSSLKKVPEASAACFLVLAPMARLPNIADKICRYGAVKSVRLL